MKSVVIYATRSGNTKHVAEQIAAVLRESGETAVFEASTAPREFPDADLLVVGGPTEGHGMTPTVKDYLGRLSMIDIAGQPVAAFDTRLAWPVILSGSAAAGIADKLRDLGGDLIVGPESFIVDRTPALRPGELERAGQWARDVANIMTARAKIPAAV